MTPTIALLEKLEHIHSEIISLKFDYEFAKLELTRRLDELAVSVGFYQAPARLVEAWKDFERDHASREVIHTLDTLAASGAKLDQFVLALQNLPSSDYREILTSLKGNRKGFPGGTNVKPWRN